MQGSLFRSKGEPLNKLELIACNLCGSSLEKRPRCSLEAKQYMLSFIFLFFGCGVLRIKPYIIFHNHIRDIRLRNVRNWLKINQRKFNASRTSDVLFLLVVGEGKGYIKGSFLRKDNENGGA